MGRIYFRPTCILYTLYAFLGAIICCRPMLKDARATVTSSIPTIARYFTTKGRYEEVNPHLIGDIYAVNTSVLQALSPGCREMHLSAIIRHGTRYPTSKNVEKMQMLYNLIVHKASGNAIWVREIKEKFVMRYTEDMDGRLADKGVLDHKHLAVRLSKLFPSLVSREKLRGGKISFVTSSKHRCVNSTLAFKRGLTDLWSVEEEVEHTVNDTLMRFFNECPRFVKEVEEKPGSMAERDKFELGPEMLRVEEKMADRLGLPYNLINADMTQAAFHFCAYEFALNTVNSPWCRLFDEVDAQVMEYLNDLKQYWKRGYGHLINSQSSCILFHDLFSRLDKAAEESKSGGPISEAVSIQVGHAETLLPLLTLLGLFKDEVRLTAANFAAQGGRSFRTSRTLPYAANLVVALYDCDEGGELRVQALLNEEPLTFPGMEAAPLYRVLRQHYLPLLKGCVFEEVCRLPPQRK
ncbi:multiple inositol polyphosphate phosphatase 1-like [Gadus chalcogrammus]|uniref:multiple inositol polyphosphate phosphatase 1-like n=1 Tax=Gadus chalcogrammus TaxID=1042646 RepID=UPI0024C4AD9B|nr:multiple inositol polyphosphate phosphatase 1-like [Gadus chalcogrammus]